MISVKTIVFDMGGVLLDLDRQACIDAFAAIGYAKAGEMLDPYLQTGKFLQLEEGTLTPKELYTWIREDSGKDISDQAIDNALMKFVAGLPVYKLQILLDLRQQGYQVFMLSNTNPIMFPAISEKYFTQQGKTVNDYFDRLFVSYEMGVVKPHAEIFEMMIRKTGIRPDETLFIDDGKANIEIAQKLGFHTYLAIEGTDFRPIFNDYTLKP